MIREDEEEEDRRVSNDFDSSKKEPLFRRRESNKKRHQTAYNIENRMKVVNVAKRSMVEPKPFSNLRNLDTIKSIQVHDSNKTINGEIISELKTLISRFQRPS